MYPRHINHWIGDAEVGASSGATFEKRRPADDGVIAHVTRGTAVDVGRAVGAAACAADAWGRLPAPRRGELLDRAAASLRAAEDEFADVIHAETGKPRKYAAAEPTPDEAKDAITGYLAYFGTYSVDEQARIITHHRKANINPGQVGDDVARGYVFESNDRLVLTPAGSTNKIVWERAR